MDVQVAAPPSVVSSTRQCVCGGWTRYVVCQYCGTTDPAAAAAGLMSIRPLVQLTPEQAAAHPPVPVSPQAASGWGAESDSSTTVAETGMAAFAGSALPPTTFAEAQFGAVPSAAAVFASTAAPQQSGQVFSPVDETPATATEPVAYTEPIPGWSAEPVPAPSGWSTSPAATTPPAGTPAHSAPSAFTSGAFTVTPPALPTMPAGAAFTAASAPAVSEPEVPVKHEVPVSHEVPVNYEGTVDQGIPASQALAAAPASYEEPHEFAAPQGYAPQAYPAPIETVAAPAPWPDPVLPTFAQPAVDAPPPEITPKGRRTLPRWALPATLLVVVVAAAGLYLSNEGDSSSNAPIIIPTHAPRAVSSAAAVAPSAPVANAPVAGLTVTAAAPTGWTPAGPATTVTGAALSAADTVHRATELAAAGVTSASVQTVNGPNSLHILALTETASSPAAAAELSTHARHLGYTVQVVQGSTVIALHAGDKTDAYTSVLPSWAAKLKG